MGDYFEDFRFHVEEVLEGEELTFRATLADDFVTWGHGDSPFEAIEYLCAELKDEWEVEEE